MESMPVVTGASLDSIDRLGMPDSERGGVGAVHCGKDASE